MLLAAIGWGILILLNACGPEVVGSSPSATGAARDHCAELGFVDGGQHNDDRELVAECSPGPTPAGGAYSIARYLGPDGLTAKESATNIEITEYDADGNELNTTFGTLDED